MFLQKLTEYNNYKSGNLFFRFTRNAYGYNYTPSFKMFVYMTDITKTVTI